jgi:hypothetical protein
MTVAELARAALSSPHVIDVALAIIVVEVVVLARAAIWMDL